MVIKSSILDHKPQDYPGIWLSVSKVKSFDQCKSRYRYCYIDQLPTKQGESQVFGEFVHEVLEGFHRKIIDGSKEPENIIMSASFKESANGFNERINKEQKDEAWQISNKYLTAFCKQKETNELPDVIDVEAKFYVDIAGKVLLNGLIDKIQHDKDGILHVLDYKTTKNKKYLVKDYLQLMMYAYVMCLADYDIKNIKASYVLLRHDLELITKIYDRAEIMEIEKVMLDYANKINSEKLWRPTVSPLCKYCDYLSICSDGTAYTNERDKIKFGEQEVKFGEQDW